ncbi:hypothetical protein J32TS6_36840 [Virgibacillus pantothenticus]|nr:hypothetical protein J32TS6_36840 [Virgibacillus pantothenticus]
MINVEYLIDRKNINVVANKTIIINAPLSDISMIKSSLFLVRRFAIYGASIKQPKIIPTMA